MPTKPSRAATKVSNDAVKIMNTIRSMASTGYADTVPMILEEGIGEVGRLKTLDQIRNVGTILQGMPNLMNEFFNILNRIAFEVVKSANFYNKLNILKKGYVDYGETIEEIFVNIAKSHTYDVNEGVTNMLSPEDSDIRSAFHAMNYQHFYKVTIYPYQIKQTFLSFDGVGTLIDYIIKSALTAADLDEYVATKYLIDRTALDGKIYAIYQPTLSATTGNDFAKALIENADLLSYIPAEYNIAKVPNGTPISRQIIIGTAAFKSGINVDVLAPAFNMDKVELVGRLLSVDYFSFSNYETQRLAMLFEKDPNYIPFTEEENAQLKTIQCVQGSEEWFQIYDNLATQREFENGESLYRNMWFHYWKTFSISPYENMILYSSTPAGVTSVSITPATATVSKGQSILLKANMVTTGFASKEILWELSGDGIASSISQDGLLTVGQNETATEITVKVTSIADESKTATATITIA